MSSLLALFWLATASLYELGGQIVPECEASVSLFGATTPFSESALSDARGRFRFRKLQPGTYTIAVFVPGRGEARRTIEVGPSLADKRRRVFTTLELSETKFENQDSLRRQAVVSARQLAIPQKAVEAYAEAQKKLARRDIPAAEQFLRAAVGLAPQYATAWNNLGTIAYQTRRYPEAEQDFRIALEADPEAYEPLVNLGGVLVTLERAGEALPYNQHAVLRRPGDALANSQLGMNYFLLGRLDEAQKYLTAAKHIDPAHFSHPQRMLAAIYLRRGEKAAAADELQDLLRRHPDSPDAEKIRADIARLRADASRDK